jgi:putative molybdopterin biosynthesis protein
MIQSQLESVSSSAKRIGISVGRFYDLVRNGVLPPGVVVRLGRHIHIHPERLDQFIESGGKALPGGWRKEAR